MKIRTKLRLWFLVLAAILVVLLVVSFWAAKKLDRGLDLMTRSSLAEASAAHALIATLTDIEVFVLKISPEKGHELSAEARAANREVLTRHAERFIGALDAAKEASDLGAELAGHDHVREHEEAETANISSLKQRFSVLIQSVFELPAFAEKISANAREPEEVLEILQDDLEPQMLRYMRTSIDEQRTVATGAREMSTFTQRIFFGFVIGAIVLIVVGLMLTSRAVAKPLGQFAEAAYKITHGDRKLRLHYNSRDEFGELGQALDGMLDSLRDSTVSRQELEYIIRERTAELQASRENLQITLDSIGDGVLATDVQGRVTGLNPVAQHLTGWSEKDAVGRPVEEVFRIVREGTREPMTVPVNSVLASGETKGLENHTLLLGRDGQETPVADSCAPIRDADRRVIGAVLIFRDVTQERAVERAVLKANDSLERLVKERTAELEESERRHRTLVSNLQGMAYRYGLHNGQWGPEFVSEGCRAILGVSPEELTSGAVVFRKLVHPDDLEPARQIVFSALKAGKSFSVEYRTRHADGDWCWIAGQGRGVWNAAGELDAFEGYMGDVTERKVTEIALRLLSTELADASGSAFFQAVARRVADLLGAELGFVAKVISKKPPRIEMVGLSLDGQPQASYEFDPTGSPCEQIEDRDALIIPDGLANRFPENEHIIGWRVAGFASVPLLDAAGRVVGRLGVMSRRPLRHTERVEALLRLFAVRAATEIERAEGENERQRLESQLRQSQKMEALGTLAGGIAHDFNNMLGGIVGFTELLKTEPMSSQATENLQLIEVAANRARNLVKQILTFSRRTEVQRVSLRLPAVVEEATRLLRSTLPAMVQLRVHTLGQCPPVLADPTQVHQVVINLCTNAWQALPEHGGCIDVELGIADVSSEMVKKHPGLKSGNYARVRVKDNGCGMDAAMLERIFDPFFTTKPAGKGTGLGLAVVHGIMQLHEGAVVVQSTPGKGTTFDLYFPAISADEEDIPAAQKIQVLEPASRPGGHVLLVDDEALISLSNERLLRRAGFEVTTATSGEDAIAWVREQPQNFDLMLTDLAMPGMTGMELAREVRLLHPKLPIILMTGYLDPELHEQIERNGINTVLRKPVTSARLVEAITAGLKPKNRPTG